MIYQDPLRLTVTTELVSRPIQEFEYALEKLVAAQYRLGLQPAKYAQVELDSFKMLVHVYPKHYQVSNRYARFDAKAIREEVFAQVGVASGVGRAIAYWYNS